MDIYAVTGKPVAHSLSPNLFNHAFASLGLEASYTRLGADSALEALKTACQIGIRGLNVTSPFKEEMARLLDNLDPVAKRLGAVNGVIFYGSQTFGFNTDPQGIASSLNHHGINLNKKDVLVLGAGGAGRAAVLAMLEAGANVSVINRTLSKAKEVAQKFGCEFKPLQQLPEILNRAQIVISAIPQGDSLIKARWLNPGQVILDASYQYSKFSQLALQRGCRLVSGIDWLIFQAIPAFRFFTGRKIEYPKIKDALSESESYNKIISSISLVGMMGTGKTTIGQDLASALQMEVLDIDKAIEKEAGHQIPWIFKHQGEKVFRLLEHRIIQRLKTEPKKGIYALGGGAVSNPLNRQVIKNYSYVIWLWAGQKKILGRISREGRPLLDVSDKSQRLAELLSCRIADYARCSDLIINAEQPRKKIVRKIINEIH